jgi:NTE family protein
VSAFKSGTDPHRGFFISTVSELDKWPQPEKRPYLPTDSSVTRELARISTRLSDTPDEQQELLVNWGFAAADAGLLAYLDPDLPAAPLPYPDRPLHQPA